MTDKWCCEKLEELKIKENQIDTLNEIRVCLQSTANLEANVTQRLLSSPEIYNCLEEQSTENVFSNKPLDLVSDILSICMSNLTLQDDLPQILQRALMHKMAPIRALALQAILKEIEHQKKTDEKNEAAAITNDLLKHILRALQNDSVQVGNPALNILSIVLVDKLQDFVKQSLLEALKQDEIIKCRVYELAVNIAKKSPKSLDMVEFILDSALAELDNDDVLLQVNILTLFARLAETNHGLCYLETQKVIDVLSRRVENLEANPLDKLLVPGIMTFFSKIANFHPRNFITGYPHMLTCLFECLHTDDITILPVSFDTMANICQSEQGALLLAENYATPMKDVMHDYASHLRNLPSELKSRAFASLSMIFHFDKAPSAELSTILQEWFWHLNNSSGAITYTPTAINNMQFLMDFCRNPFPDIKIACLEFIGVICTYPWGLMALKNTAGFLEYLLDRKIEYDKESKFAKYCVIQLLAESNVFDVQTNAQLRTYVNEGPYYVQSMMDVAVEGN